MIPMLPFYHPLCYTSDSLFSYVDRISVEEKDDNFVYQFANMYDIKHRKYIRIIKHEDHCITGTPIQLPKYEGIPRAFSKTTYGFDISTSPWQDKVNFCYEPQEYKFKMIENYIDIPFDKAVYPISVSVRFTELHEILNPVNIIRIWAQDSDNQWFQLWNRSPQIMLPASRLFSAPLKSRDFKTKMLRLEFKPSLWDYYIKVDTVKFIGTSKLNLPRNPEESNLSLRNVNSDYVQRLMQKDDSCRPSLKNDLNSVIKLSSDESKELLRCSLSVLPDEIILKILVNLDLMTLCRLNQVNKRFYYLTQDSVLYKRLNVRNICHINTMCNIFRYFRPRCKNLQQLDLTGSDFSISNFVKFLDNCGSHLTHLRLSRCSSVNYIALHNISKICKNLKQLDLDGCEFISDKGFSYLKKLQSLEHLNVNYTNIKTERLCKILQKNQQTRQLHLETLDINADRLAIHLRNSCKNLEVINLDISCRFLTSECINALADCKNLRKVKLREFEFFNNSLNRLFSSCQLLEEIVLSQVSNGTLESLTQCQNLKRVRLHDSIHVASDKYSVIFEQCPKLQEFHFINCNTNSRLVNQWRERYPRVFIYVEIYKELYGLIIQE